MLRRQHGTSWPTLATRLYHPLLPVDLPCICTELLYIGSSWSSLPLLVHVKGSTGVCRLWVLPYFSSSVPNAWLVGKYIYSIFIGAENHVGWCSVTRSLLTSREKHLNSLAKIIELADLDDIHLFFYFYLAVNKLETERKEPSHIFFQKVSIVN